MEFQGPGVLDDAAAELRRQIISDLKAPGNEPDGDFQTIVRQAARLFGAQAGIISLVDGDSLWFYARHGVERTSAPAIDSFASVLVGDAEMNALVVLDTSLDVRFVNASLVTAEPRARFYAGVPISIHGQRIGALCALSPDPRGSVDAALLPELTDLAKLCGRLFELRDEARVRALTAAELIKEEWRHALTLEAGQVGSWVWDLRSGEIVTNEIFRQMFQLPAPRLALADMMSTIYAPDVPRVNAALADTFENGVDYNVEFRVAGTGRWLIGRGRVYQRDGAGKPLVMMGVNIDITDARAAAEQTRQLLRELNHRVKNTLAVIQSLARQTSGRTTDPQAFVETFSGRLRTLLEAHSLLADRDWSGIGLIELIRLEIEPYLLEDPEQVTLTGQDVDLPPDHALGLGLVLHELASNAARYGALSGEGRVSLIWDVLQDPYRLELTWKEVGGPQVALPSDPGFGMRLIERSLDKVINSSVRVNFAPDGVEASIVLPLR